jgi:hypothetical protein
MPIGPSSRVKLDFLDSLTAVDGTKTSVSNTLRSVISQNTTEFFFAILLLGSGKRELGKIHLRTRMSL